MQEYYLISLIIQVCKSISWSLFNRYIHFLVASSVFYIKDNVAKQRWGIFHYNMKRWWFVKFKIKLTFKWLSLLFIKTQSMLSYIFTKKFSYYDHTFCHEISNIFILSLYLAANFFLHGVMSTKFKVNI